MCFQRLVVSVCVKDEALCYECPQAILYYAYRWWQVVLRREWSSALQGMLLQIRNSDRPGRDPDDEMMNTGVGRRRRMLVR